MRKFILSAIIISIAAGIVWAQGEEGGDYNYSYSPDTTQCSPNLGVIFYGGLLWNQTAMNTYNTANAYKDSFSQAMPVVNYGIPNLPSAANYPAIDYQNMTVKMLSQKADFNNYALEEMKKNDEMMSKNTWENNSCPIGAATPLDKYSPAFSLPENKK